MPTPAAPDPAARSVGGHQLNARRPTLDRPPLAADHLATIQKRLLQLLRSLTEVETQLSGPEKLEEWPTLVSRHLNLISQVYALSNALASPTPHFVPHQLAELDRSLLDEALGPDNLYAPHAQGELAATSAHPTDDALFAGAKRQGDADEWEGEEQQGTRDSAAGVARSADHVGVPLPVFHPACEPVPSFAGSAQEGLAAANATTTSTGASADATATTVVSAQLSTLPHLAVHAYAALDADRANTLASVLRSRADADVEERGAAASSRWRARALLEGIDGRGYLQDDDGDGDDREDQEGADGGAGARVRSRRRRRRRRLDRLRPASQIEALGLDDLDDGAASTSASHAAAVLRKAERLASPQLRRGAESAGQLEPEWRARKLLRTSRWHARRWDEACGAALRAWYHARDAPDDGGVRYDWKMRGVELEEEEGEGEEREGKEEGEEEDDDGDGIDEDDEGEGGKQNDGEHATARRSAEVTGQREASGRGGRVAVSAQGLGMPAREWSADEVQAFLTSKRAPGA